MNSEVCSRRLLRSTFTSLRRPIRDASATLLASLLGLGSLSAQGQPAEPETSGETVVLNPFVVDASLERGYNAASSLSGTRLNTKLIDTPLSISVLTRELMDDVGAAQELSKAVAYTANVTVTDRRTDTFRLRGFSSTSYRDGVAVASNVGFDDVIVQRLEVVRGPTSVLYGVSQPGGLVNAITKAPLDYAMTQFGATVGSYDFYRATFDSTGPVTQDKKFLYRVVASYLDMDSWRGFEWQKRTFISPMMTWRPSNNTDITATFYHQKGEGLYNSIQMWWNDVDHTFLNLPRDWFRGDATDRNDQEVDSAKIELTHRFNDAWSLRVLGLWADSYYQTLDSFTGTVSRVNGRLVTTTTQRDLTINPETINVQGNLLGKFNTGPASHVLLAGAEQREGKEFRRDIRKPWTDRLDILAPNNHGTLVGTTTMSQAQITENTGTALFLQETLGLLEDRLFLIGGVRYEDFETSSRTHNRLNNTVTGPQTLGDKETTKRLGALWKVTPRVSAYATYNEGFNGSLGVDIVTGNLLKSEKSEGVEGGFKFNLLDDRFTGSIAYYDVSRLNITLTDPGSGARVQRGEITSTGVEVDLFYQLTPQWQLIAGFATCDSRVTNDVNPAFVGLKSENTPEETFVVWTKYNFENGPLKGFFAGIGGRYEGKKTDRDNTAYQDPSTVVNALVGWENRRVRLQLNLDNLFNEDYWEEIQITRAAKRGAPFEGRFTATYKF